MTLFLILFNFVFGLGIFSLNILCCRGWLPRGSGGWQRTPKKATGS